MLVIDLKKKVASINGKEKIKLMWNAYGYEEECEIKADTQTEGKSPSLLNYLCTQTV